MEPIVVISKQDLHSLIESATEQSIKTVLSKIRPDLAEEKEWMSNNEAMRFLGLSRSTLARYRVSGKLIASKIGSNIYYRRIDIEALLESGLPVCQT